MTMSEVQMKLNYLEGSHQYEVELTSNGVTEKTLCTESTGNLILDPKSDKAAVRFMIDQIMAKTKRSKSSSQPSSQSLLPLPSISPRLPTSQETLTENNPGPSSATDSSVDTASTYCCPSNESQNSPTENKGVVIPTTSGTCMPWNKSQTLLLISEYQRHEAKVTSGFLRKKMLWQKIEAVFKEHGYSFTADQISGRWKTITRAFKITKDHNNKSGNDKKHYEFEDALNDVLGDCPTVNPVTVSSAKKHKLPNIDPESTEGDDDSGSSKSDSYESSKPKSKKSNSSEIIDLLKQHSEQQQEFQREYRQMQAKESERKEKEHTERLLVLNNLIDAIKSSKK